MGKIHKDTLSLNFDHKLKLEFHGTKVTSYAGPLAYCQLDEAHRSYFPWESQSSG